VRRVPLRAAWCAALVLGQLGAAAPAAGQALRMTGSTTLRFIEVRPLIRDSVPAEETEGGGLLRQTTAGRVVRCIPGEPFCRDVRPGERISTLPLVQDLEVSGWGFGEGLRIYSQLRARASWGADPGLWPRSEDALDLLAGYVELDRTHVRLRLGRQWRVSGLGFYNFDGAAVAVRPFRPLWLEGYAGRSLVRGLNEPRTGGAVEAIEALAPPQPGLLLGLHARFRPHPNLALSSLYQVDFRSDRRGLYSELASFDAAFRLRGASVEGSLELDAAAGAVNEARVRLRPPPFGASALHLELRRYRPYFELWTIWGAFSPVGFDEARAGVTWSTAPGRLLLRGDAAYRKYDDAGGDGAFGDFRDDGWSIGTQASWAPSDPWRVEAGVRVDAGFGAASRDARLAGVRRLGGSGSIALHAVAFQRLYEFRLDEGTVVGLGGEAAVQLTERVGLFGSGMIYRHLAAGPGSGLDWNQRRGSLRLQWTVGSEPGMPPRPGAAP
jgi:hypothetical protein